MSEEEIIKECKRIIFEYGCIRKDTKGEKEDLEALEGLLDLYNKEKVKNKYYEDKFKDIECEKIYENLYKDIVEIVHKEYISKDKIREFIKEYLPNNELMECCECFDSNGILIRKKLEELLEE